ncbi:hypothetical protein C7S10_08575 [Nocardioides currus]|uniref:Uncharacterized protein n=2 Tax=Nocardioides currus TaxID=2133958 RepID=A0A2R7Z0C6_9ACTN|nr:hypothetical protein C7S10_08575 [Nocardioides currus]
MTTRDPDSMSTPDQRAQWRRRATWLTQLGLAPDDPAPAEIVEDVTHAALQLLNEIERLEDELRESRSIGVWLYDHLSPGARILLGDVSEWPWLVSDTDGPGPDGDPAPQGHDNAE